MTRFFLLMFLSTVMCADSISEKKAAFVQRSVARDADIAAINQKICRIKKNLTDTYEQAEILVEQQADEGSFLSLLQEVNRLKKEKEYLEEGWREAAVAEGHQDGELYSLWDQEEIPLSQLVMEYGSQDYLYVIPSEFSGLRLHLYSNIPIPRQSWSELLEIVLYHNGFGVKKLNHYTRQIYLLKQDLGAVGTIAYRKDQLPFIPAGTRICYLISPAVEQVKSAFQFFDKFSDAKQTFVHQLGNKIAVVAMKEEVERLVQFYEKVWSGQEGKVTKVVSVSKIPVKEMEKILTTFFAEALEKNRPPFGKIEQENLGVFSLGQTNSIVLIGSKESVERAEMIVKETENQMEDPAEMTVHLYRCAHSDPTDLAQILERVYLSLLSSNQETSFKETESSASSVQGGKPSYEGAVSSSSLVVNPPPFKPGSGTRVDMDLPRTDHFIPDLKTGTLLMTVRRDMLGRIQELLKKLDVPKKMVQIEILLFERRIDSQTDFGMNLLQLGKKKQGVSFLSTMRPGESDKDFGKGVLQFFFQGSGHRNIPHFDLAYNFLLTQSDIQLNAAPSVVTVNQTPATINIVEEQSINSGAAPVNTASGTITYEKSYARAQYGIVITVTPIVHASMNLEERNLVTLRADITFDTTMPDADDRPRVDRRHIENEVRIMDGETAIIGGLRRKIKRDREEKIPFLGDLPVLGRFFGTTKLVEQETEIILTMTPTIIADPQEEVEKYRVEELKKRPGDTPALLEKVKEAQDRQRQRFFKHSLKNFLLHGR